MSATIDESSRSILEGKNFCHVATLREDGSVHGVVVWIDLEGDRVLLNSAEGRAWPNNLERDPRVTLTVPNQENPYEFVSLRGRMVEMTPDGADGHADRMAKKYMDLDEYPFRQPGEVRIKVYIEPDKVTHQGG